MKNLLRIAALSFSCFLSDLSEAQTGYFKNDEYRKALWMTTRMYGGQRSGDNNWYVYNHLPNKLWTNPPVAIEEKYRGRSFFEDNDNGYNLSGGWHDCGDHVKFGQTEFYSGYVLLKGYAEFPQGYDDHYSQNYAGYKSSGKWNWEETGHDPDGIADVVNEVKHATDFFIKCAKDDNTFYFQIGDGGPDHAVWCTSVLKQSLSKEQGGQPRTCHKNPADASMPSLCGATLALMSRVYRGYSQSYADSCIVAAKHAYAYAKKQNGTIAAPGGFYPANENWRDDFASLCAELYWATGEEKYKTEALSFSVGMTKGKGDVYGNPGYAFCYNDNGDIALYNLALLGKPGADSIVNAIAEAYLAKINASDGLFQGGDATWGPLRYNANVAWIVALNLKLKQKANTVPKFIYDQIDYILGKNSANLSFVVGFGTKSPLFPHHRDIYCADGGDDKKPGPIPAKNKQSGFMVGGKRNPSEFIDDPVNYVHTEGGIDYQAGLVGALAYINSVLAPVDLAKYKPFYQVGQPTAVNEVANAGSVMIYPNPTTENFSIYAEMPMEIKVYDNLGQLVEQLTSGGGEKKFGQQLIPGVYHVNCLKDGKVVKTMNIVKNW